MPRSYYKTIVKIIQAIRRNGPVYERDTKTIVQMVPGTAGSFGTIVANANEGATPTPTILKVKHLRVAADLYVDSTALNGGFVCLLYHKEYA